MSKHVRNFTLFLCFLMVFMCIFTSCAEKTDKERGEYKRAEGEGRESTPDSLPDDLDFKGYEYQLFYRSGDMGKYECEGFNGENASAVFVSVFERNERVTARLNCNFKWIPSTTGGGLPETREEINQILLKMDYYDCIFSSNNTTLTLGLNAGLCELNDAEYIDYTQPWWWNDVIDELSYDGFTINFLVGDMNLVNFQKMSALYFNYDLIESLLQMTPQNFYQLVDDKEWTIDRFHYLTKKCYKDTANNPGGTGVKDDGDIYGFEWVGQTTIEQFMYSTKILDQLYTRKRNGQIETHLEENETIVDLVGALSKLFHENEGARDKGMIGYQGYDSSMITNFANGNCVFLAQRLHAACSDAMREMETNYGIIPYPLLEEGDEYVSWIQGSSTCMCVPGIVERTPDALERSCALLEALCSEAYRYTSVAFFENALKNKYTRDDDAARMIDIIYNSAAKNFLVEYGSCANSICAEIYVAIDSKSSVTTRFASNEEASIKKLNNFISDTAAQYNN